MPHCGLCDYVYVYDVFIRHGPVIVVIVYDKVHLSKCIYVLRYTRIQRQHPCYPRQVYNVLRASSTRTVSRARLPLIHTCTRYNDMPWMFCFYGYSAQPERCIHVLHIPCSYIYTRPEGGVYTYTWYVVYYSWHITCKATIPGNGVYTL